MKKKIFFVALILFHVFLNSMILIVSNVILRDKLSVVREQCLAEHYVIASSLLGDMQALEQRGNSVEENIDGLMRLYSRYLQGKGNGLAVSFSGKVLPSRGKKAGKPRRIRATVRIGLCIWKTGVSRYFAFMAAFRLLGRITGLCISEIWKNPSDHGAIRKIFFLLQASG